MGKRELDGQPCSTVVLLVLLLLHVAVAMGSTVASKTLDRYVSTLSNGRPPVLMWKTGRESSLCASLLTSRQQDDARFHCASLVIPFDYADQTAGTGNLTLLRFRPNQDANKT